MDKSGVRAPKKIPKKILRVPVTPEQGWSCLFSIVFLGTLIFISLVIWFSLAQSMKARQHKNHCLVIRSAISNALGEYNYKNSPSIAGFADADVLEDGRLIKARILAVPTKKDPVHWTLDLPDCWYEGGKCSSATPGVPDLLIYSVGTLSYFVNCMAHGPDVANPDDKRLTRRDDTYTVLAGILRQPKPVFYWIVFLFLTLQLFHFLKPFFSANWQIRGNERPNIKVLFWISVLGLLMFLGAKILSDNSFVAVFIYAAFVIFLGLFIQKLTSII